MAGALVWSFSILPSRHTEQGCLSGAGVGSHNCPPLTWAASGVERVVRAGCTCLYVVGVLEKKSRQVNQRGILKMVTLPLIPSESIISSEGLLEFCLDKKRILSQGMSQLIHYPYLGDNGKGTTEDCDGSQAGKKTFGKRASRESQLSQEKTLQGGGGGGEKLL